MSGTVPQARTRLAHPLVRDSRDEPFRTAGWDEALTRVAQELSRAYGAFGMFFCAHGTSDTNRAAQEFARVVMGTADVGSRRMSTRIGTGVPMAHAIGREIIHAGLADHAFIERATSGFEEYRQLVEPWTLSLAEKVTGVPAAAIRELAHGWARGEHARVYSTDNVHALTNLSLLTGHAGRHGSGLEPLETGAYRAVYCIGEDPAGCEVDGERAIRGLKALDFLVVQDGFLTRTAELADVVLPMAVGGTRDGIDIIQDVATRLGHDLHQYQVDTEAVRNGPRPVSPTERDPRTSFRLVRHDPPVDLTDDRYPVRLTTGRRLDFSNSSVHRGGSASPLRRGECVELSPEDAERYSVVVGEEVRVSTRRGSLMAPVWVDPALRSGLAFMTMVLPEGADINQLTARPSCPIAGTAEFKASAIRIEKLPVSAAGS